jgi:RNA polymerase sigma factor (sigma-70 family)
VDTTQQIERALVRLSQGDLTAREELFRRSERRLRALVGRYLGRDFSRLAAVEQTDDLLQDVYVRWLKSWEQLLRDDQGQIIQDPATFLSRVARLIREVLLDSVRHHFGRTGNRPDVRRLGEESSTLGTFWIEPGTQTHDPALLARLTECHQAIEALPPPLKQVVDLHYYQGLTHEETAAVLGLGESTVRKYWVKARLELIDRFGENPFQEVS